MQDEIILNLIRQSEDDDQEKAPVQTNNVVDDKDEIMEEEDKAMKDDINEAKSEKGESVTSPEKLNSDDSFASEIDDHQPKIMKRATSVTEYSPSFKGNSKLLTKRKSIAPIRFRRGDFEVELDSKESAVEEAIPSIQSKARSPKMNRFDNDSKPQASTTSSNAPNLTKLLNDKPKRPDSSMSNSSTSTTTASCTLSEADSGIDIGRRKYF